MMLQSEELERDERAQAKDKGILKWFKNNWNEGLSNETEKEGYLYKPKTSDQLKLEETLKWVSWVLSLLAVGTSIRQELYAFFRDRTEAH